MRVSPIAQAEYKVNSFKGIETGNTFSRWADPRLIFEHDSFGMPQKYTTNFETLFHDYYKLYDETSEELAEFKKKYSPEYKYFKGDPAKHIESLRRHDWYCLGTLPIKVSEWAQYLADKTLMEKEDIAFVEKVLERFNLKHLIK